MIALDLFAPAANDDAAITAEMHALAMGTEPDYRAAVEARAAADFEAMADLFESQMEEPDLSDCPVCDGIGEGPTGRCGRCNGRGVSVAVVRGVLS